MTRTLFLLTFIFILRQANCQDSLSDNRICVKIAPLSILDIYSGTSARIGLEYKLKKNFALYNEIGTYFPFANGMHMNYGALVKIELKMYLNNFWLSSGPYLSAELFYKHQSYYTYDSIYSNTKYNKDYYVKKDIACLTIKYGFLKVLKYNIVIDGFVGLGVRQRFITNTLTSDENEHIKGEGDYNINVAKNQAGNFTYLNFDAGVKIGYRFK
ncbi:MAG: hypothetical protein V4677_12515 [Bacteroidota bacterium]